MILTWYYYVIYTFRFAQIIITNTMQHESLHKKLDTILCVGINL